jgi:hypothetical protein
VIFEKPQNSMEKSIEQMNTAELRAALDEYNRSQNSVPAAPLPPGVKVEDSQQTRDTASALYLESIMRKDAGQLTQGERDFLRASVGSALRDLGY